MKVSLYIDAALLSFPGTANHQWRDAMGDALSKGRDWLDALDVTIIGAREMSTELDAAMHLWGARVLFSASHNRWAGFVSTAALDLQPPYPDLVLLHFVRPPRGSAAADQRLANLRLHTRVRLLPARGDVVTPVVADDLEEVFADACRR